MTENVRPEGKSAALLALARGATVEAAATEAGITARTLRRWREDPEFEAQIRETRRRLLDQAVARLEHAVGDAVSVLHDAALTGEPSALQVRAAAILLGALPSLATHASLEERIAALENAAQERETREAA